MKVSFTTDESWLGGHYGFLIFPDSSASISSDPILDILWMQRRELCGPLASRYKEPESQINSISSGHNPCNTPLLYGVATLPNGSKIPCGSLVVPKAFSYYLIEFFLPLNALLKAYDMEGIPFSSQDISPWRLEVDEWLASLAWYVNHRSPFPVAYIGYELVANTKLRNYWPSQDIPVREHAILKSLGSTMKFLPRTGDWRVL